ncbi:MAG: hypothetical protein ABTB30_12800 [Clostridia bacterium]
MFIPHNPAIRPQALRLLNVSTAFICHWQRPWIYHVSTAFICHWQRPWIYHVSTAFICHWQRPWKRP